jgi:hypothetical protein
VNSARTDQKPMAARPETVGGIQLVGTGCIGVVRPSRLRFAPHLRMRKIEYCKSLASSS